MDPSTSNPRAATPAPGDAAFATTRWSVVLGATATDGSHAQAALEDLCRIYWRPIYAFLRRSGRSPHDAQDLTQGFLARLLAAPSLARVEPARGRFRSFLLASLKHFLANEHARERTRKRGGHIPRIPLGFPAEADTEHAPGPDPAATSLTPDAAFDRQWALSLLNRVLGRLGEEYAAAGKAALFQHLRETLTSPRGSLPYSVLGQALGLSEGAVKVAVHRLRCRYRELLRAEIVGTLEDPSRVDEELHHLFAALAR